ncbi:putative oxidoreductase YjmC [Longimycelium tulufanense]|uniref:Putative oxidoreductase YjmC n=1 Tax=Longimycelium tulufanense TaxID=907463 RepID=A0A8J3CJX2_9PSEU|nr:Ldh family oxidoreductase [Longimycelium tulufanense]GGM80566.1 putative oxidoreductase YjmC [Longimycelium tulufanense]
MTTRINSKTLRNFVVTVFERCGLRRTAAETAAAVVCYADERGFTTHGCNALVNTYVPRLRDGRISPSARPEVLMETPAGATLDGQGGLGLVTMTRAVDMASRKAHTHGVGAVAVRNSSHFGSAGYYTHRLARSGLVGIAMTNCGAQGVVPPLGGAIRLLGTNPLSAAVPSARRPPFVLDMSTTVVATGKLALARAEQREVPPGWLIGRNGEDVTDPAAYFNGSADVAWLGGRITTGGAKGYGLALLVDLLCGPLAGASFGPRRDALSGPPAEDHDVGHFALAIDPTAFDKTGQFLDSVDEVLGTVESCPPSNSGSVTYPGAPEARRANEAEEQGVALSDQVMEKLLQLAEELGIPELFQEVLPG